MIIKLVADIVKRNELGELYHESVNEYFNISVKIKTGSGRFLDELYGILYIYN